MATTKRPAKSTKAKGSKKASRRKAKIDNDEPIIVRPGGGGRRLLGDYVDLLHQWTFAPFNDAGTRRVRRHRTIGRLTELVIVRSGGRRERYRLDEGDFVLVFYPGAVERGRKR